MTFDLNSAIDAAARGEIAAWVVAYLRGPGRNAQFADGLQMRDRFWEGPALVPLAALHRKCGPEPGMPFAVSRESWEERTSAIAMSFTQLDAFPPVIAEYRAGKLFVSDGNHRVGAFEAMGLKECWAIVWYPDEAEKAHHDRLMEE